jgi:hypothetical protein
MADQKIAPTLHRGLTIEQRNPSKLVSTDVIQKLSGLYTTWILKQDAIIYNLNNDRIKYGSEKVQSGYSWSRCVYKISHFYQYLSIAVNKLLCSFT